MSVLAVGSEFRLESSEFLVDHPVASLGVLEPVTYINMLIPLPDMAWVLGVAGVLFLFDKP